MFNEGLRRSSVLDILNTLCYYLPQPYNFHKPSQLSISFIPVISINKMLKWTKSIHLVLNIIGIILLFNLLHGFLLRDGK